MKSGRFSSLPRAKHFWFLMLNVAVTGLASTMLGPFLPVFLYKQLNISVGAVSFVYFVSGLVGTFTTLLMGWLVDRVGRRKIYAFGISSAAVIPAALSKAATFLQIFPLITVSGVMDSAARSSQTAIIADQVEGQRRVTAYGVSRIVGNASWIVAPLIGGAILASSSGFQPLFLVSAFVGLVGLVIFIALVPESRKEGLEKPRLPKIGVLRDKELLVLCVASLFTMLFYTQFYSLLPIFATQVKGLDSVELGALFSVSGATVVALQFPTSHWLEKIPKQTGYILGVVILAAGITGLALAPNFYWMLVAVVLMTLGENMFFPIAQTLVTEIAPEAERGMYVGAFGLFLSIGANLSPLLGGTIWQVTGNANLPWLLSPVYAAISVTLAVLFRPKHSRRS
jgi:MFS family permease